MNWATLICSSAALSICWGASCARQSEPAQGEIAKTDAVIRARFANIEGYTVTEHFAVYRNGSTIAAAERTVQATYEKDRGTTYKTTSQSGSTIWQSQVIEPSLKSDQLINDPAMRSQLMLTTDNYEFQVEPEKASIGSHGCVVLDVRAGKPSIYLINGKAWVEANSYRLVRIQGIQSKSQSLWAGTPVITRDFTDVNGFAMVTHERIEAHNFVLGRTVEEIDYRDYTILSDTKVP